MSIFSRRRQADKKKRDQKAAQKYTKEIEKTPAPKKPGKNKNSKE